MNNENLTGEFRSPGGFVFGVQGWTWGDQKPSSITFFLDGTCKVSDQHGRPIKGTVKDQKITYFDKCTHAQVIEALAGEGIDWTRLVWAGWPQLPYEDLKKLKNTPPWPFMPEHIPMTSTGQTCTCVMCSIRDPQLRRDALKLKAESEALIEREMQAAEAQK